MKANLHIVLEMSYSSQNSQSPNAMRGTSVIRQCSVTSTKDQFFIRFFRIRSFCINASINGSSVHCTNLLLTVTRKVIFFQFTDEQSILISPWFFVLTPTLPSFVIATTKACSKAVLLEANKFTVFLDLGSVNNTWSEVNNPFPICRFLKYMLSNVNDDVESMSIAILWSTFLGHSLLSSSTYVGLNVGSILFLLWKLYSLLEKCLQCENPIVCAPKRNNNTNSSKLESNCILPFPKLFKALSYLREQSCLFELDHVLQTQH